MLPPLVDLYDFAEFIEDNSVTEQSLKWTAKLQAASSLVRDVARQTWIDTDTGTVADVPDVVKTTVLQMVERVYLNPEGLISEQEGPFSARRGSRADEGIYLTDAERTTLEGLRPDGGSGLWTMGTTRNEALDDTVYAPVAGTDESVPWDVA